MRNTSLQGVLVPALTPFLADSRPNTQAFSEHCKWLLAQGADGLAVFGTTSEANSLSVEERMELLDVLLDSGIPPEKLLPGTGTCSIPDSVHLTRHAVGRNCAGMLMLPPFYYKGVSDEGLYAFFSDIIYQVGDERLKVYLYHIPPMSQVAFSLDLIERLATDYSDTVVGIKDSGGDWTYTASILERFPQLAIFPGSESFLLDGLRHGSAGCITASGNVNPGGIRRVFERWQQADADDLQEQITRVRKVIQSYPMIPALKTIVSGFYTEPDWLRVRPPLVPLGEADGSELMNSLAQREFSMAETRN